MNTFELYTIDTETCGLDYVKHEPVEICIYRMSTGEHKTWHSKPINIQHIDPGALKVNGLKLEDLIGQTKEGKEKYRDPKDVLVEIENWVMEDGLPTAQRLIVGHNVFFDKQMLLSLWEKCGVKDSFPFSDRYSLDTMMMQFMLDHAKGEYAEGYSLNATTKRYSIKNSKAHTAEADTLATVELFNKLMDDFKKHVK